jgi:phenylacetate-coenzyme A ligase PaaK-like adenylate-forming protein
VAGLALDRRLKAQERWPRERLEALQQRGLDRLLRHAVARSPFYRDLYRGLDLDKPIQLQQLPTIDKATLLANFDRAVTDDRLKLDFLEDNFTALAGRYYLGRYFIHASTGSSGRHGIYVFDRRERAAAVAALLRARRLMGPGTSGFAVRRVAATHPEPRLQRPSLASDLHVKRQLFLPARAPMTELVVALNSFQPTDLRLMSSLLNLLAAEQLDGRLKIRPSSIVALEDVCTPEMERRIFGGWGIRPFHHYGMSEAGGLVAADCVEHHGLHLFEDQSIVEVVDDDNRPVAAGVTGAKILVTNLSSYALPRIRFEIPDLVTLSGESCPCGRTLTLIRLVEGRSEDTVRLARRDGSQVTLASGHFHAFLERIPGIKEYQVISEGEKLRARAVIREGASAPVVAAELKRTLEEGLAPHNVADPNVEVEILDGDRIERDPNHRGKFKIVVNEGQREGEL